MKPNCKIFVLETNCTLAASIAFERAARSCYYKARVVHFAVANRSVLTQCQGGMTTALKEKKLLLSINLERVLRSFLQYLMSGESFLSKKIQIESKIPYFHSQILYCSPTKL
ncbi:hypothetical protein ATANTOWER_014216 [Ataeniobius toweri]|uniref:Uncharacterized protein n=1 Tax=Ataeniobius toweri TaxID=208326 RepID=A0ABU7BST0_9TELE|nr:hypothetical protein [Ataeniobius toweri]